MVIRVDDELTWTDRHHPTPATGRVIEVGYEHVIAVEYGHSLAHATRLELDEIHVTKPRLQAGDIVVLAPTTGRPTPGRVQGVVQPVRWRDGLRGHTVHWEDHDPANALEAFEARLDNRRRYHAQELLRVPVCDQHPELWPAAELAAH